MTKKDFLMLRVFQKQQDAMLELDAVLTRAMLYDLVSCCPLSM